MVAGLELERWITQPRVAAEDDETNTIAGGDEVATSLPQLLAFGFGLGAVGSRWAPSSAEQDAALALRCAAARPAW